MMTRDDFIKKLREDQRYREALGRARTSAERKMISDLVETFVKDAAEIMVPVIELMQNDPGFATQLGKALIEQHNVLTTTQTSGSKA